MGVGAERPVVRAASRPLDGALDQAVGLGGGLEDLVVVAQTEGGEVDEQVVAVGQREMDALDLRVGLEDRLAHAMQRVLHRGAVVVGEGAQEELVGAAPDAPEVGVAVAVGPGGGDARGEDAVRRVLERREAVLVEALEP
jgi:hypothetical protein